MIRDTTLRVGIIGAGDIAGAHIRGYLQSAESAQVTAIADVDAERAQRLAERVGNAQVFGDYREMMGSSLVDAVDICLPHHLHKDAIVAAAAAGKHVLCEKPLCLTLEEADAVTGAVAAAGITLMCAHNQLFLPPVATAREMIREGKLGKVYIARTTDSFFARAVDATALGWRARRATSGGGELIDTGYHPTYLLLHLVDSEPTRVTAMLSRHRLEFMEAEDSAQVLVEFADGAVGNIVTSWAYEPAGSTEKFSVVGEAGSLWSDKLSLYFKPRGGDQVLVTQADTEPDTFALEIADFIACLREGRRPLNNEVDGVNVLKVILAAYASADRREIVEIKGL
jgi:predicted dehydrogenase